MEALEKIMGSEFIYLDIWYLVFKYFVFGTGAREICQRGPLQWAVVGWIIFFFYLSMGIWTHGYLQGKSVREVHDG